MNTDSAVAATTPEARLELLRQRLAGLRSPTDLLTERAQDASRTAADTCSAEPRSCQHGEQVRQLTAALSGVEHELEGLHVAMTTRAVIEQAKGMLMLRERCTADEAFAMLVDLSQRGHRKLYDVATTMVATWSTADGG